MFVVLPARMTLRVGFVGLGDIGRPMAARIVRGGFATTVFDLRPEPCAALAALGAAVADSGAALAAAADVIGVCVRDDADVEALLRGPDGLLAAARPGAVIAVHSTVTPDTVRGLGAAAATRGVALVDAPMTGGAAGAENGTLTYMVGGDAAALERIRPVLATSAARIVHAGPLGAGAITKACNNLMQYMEFLAAREAVALARRAGVAAETLIEVSRSVGIMTEAMVAVVVLGDRLAAAPDDPALLARARHFAALADKDLGVALDCARAAGLALPGTAACRALMPRTYGLNEGAEP
jgi:3-hydroxyisobutyrate dehydrogenase-like beta-hydroxyacid dehydrogenase